MKRGDRAAGHRDSRPVLRPHEGPRSARSSATALVAHVGFARPGLRRRCATLVARRPATTVGATVHKGGTYVCIEGPAVLDAGRVAALPQLGHGRHRHDQPAGGQAGPRGGDLLRDHRAGDRLRLLAPRPRTSVTVEMVIGNPVGRTRRPRRPSSRSVPWTGWGPRADAARAPTRCATAIITRARQRFPRQTKRDLAPIVGKYLSVSVPSDAGCQGMGHGQGSSVATMEFPQSRATACGRKERRQ
ncbi:MAG: hypothetical protein M0C28_17485 [Candidatus Moduliflexus flocculans]|nr:hypothetical protein [Candidatus Moduliflexus flocculans]